MSNCNIAVYFYNGIETLLCTIKSQDMIIIIGNQSVKIGAIIIRKKSVGPFRLGTPNNQDDLLHNF